MSAGTSREAFEAWWGQPPIDLLATQCRTEDEKVSLWAWQSWQASRKQALEEVAALFPDISAGYRSTTIKQAIEELK